MRNYLYYTGILLSILLTSAQAADVKGSWKVHAYNATIPDGVNADWIIGLNDGILHGSAYWQVQQPDYTYENIDRLVGSINGDQVSMTRYLSAAMFAGKTQTFTGTISGKTISGSWAGTGCTNSCQWTATITPFSDSASTTTPTTNSCELPQISANLDIKIPRGLYTQSAGLFTQALSTPVWIDLQYAPQGGQPFWTVSGVGILP